MASKTERLSMRLEPRESAMLRQLAHALGESKSDVLRRLIHEAYGQKLAKLSTRAGFGFALSGLVPAASPKPKSKAKAKPKARPKAKPKARSRAKARS